MEEGTTKIETPGNHSRALTEERFREVFQYQEPEKSSHLKTIRQRLKCSVGIVFHLLPVLKWLPKYDFKNNIGNDILVAAMITPMLLQVGISYAHIAQLPVITGLYASVFPPTIYFFMGTSRHSAIGMSSVVSMMIANVVTKHASNSQLSDREYSELEIAVALTFLTGVWLLILGMLRLGSLSKIFSDTFTSAFYLAAAIYILPGRLNTLFGIEFPGVSSLFKLFHDFYGLIKRISQINFVTFGLSFVVLIVVSVFNIYGKPVIAKKCYKSKMPLLLEILLIIFSTVLSYFLDFQNKYKVEIIGDIPTSLPGLVSPPFEVLPKLILDSFVLAIILIPIYLPLTKMLSRKYSYKINCNQELVALGVANVISSFCSCPIAGNSVNRTLIQESIGGGSSFTNLFTAIFMVLVLLFIGPIAKYIPVCVLSVLIITHLTRHLLEIKKFFEIYRKSKTDAAVWLVTFFSSIGLSIEYGVIIGTIASVIAILIPSQKMEVVVLGRYPGTQIFLDKNYFKSAVTSDNILILKTIGNIDFANSENIEDMIFQRIRTCVNKSLRFVILSLSCVGYIDLAGVNSLILLSEELKRSENGPTLLLTDCLPAVYHKLSICDFFNEFPNKNVFASVQDAFEFLNTAEAMTETHDSQTRL